MKSILINLTLAFTLLSPYLLANSTESVESSPIQASDNKTRYPANFFTQYLPENALDMVNRLPGFTFNKGSSDRGFGGNAGNVLINGARPTSKSSGLQGALERIPASQVKEIIVLRGGVNVSDTGGQTVIANVIKKKTQTSGTWSFLTMRVKSGVFKPQLKGSLTTKLSEWDTSFEGEIGGQPGYRTAHIERFDANDNLTSNSDETLDELVEYFNVNGEGTRKLAQGKLTLNASFEKERIDDKIEREKTHSSLAVYTQPDEKESIQDIENLTHAELSIDWIGIKANWSLHFIALGSIQETKNDGDYWSESLITENTETKTYNKKTTETESIFRTSIAQVGSMKLKPEFGIEISLNTLENDLSLIKNGIIQDLEGADKVEELRGEVFANFVYTYNPDITIEGGITTEFSQLKAYSTTTNSQNFTFIKPRVSLNYALNEKSTLTFEIAHEIEQLDFNDFAASSNNSDDRTNAGNNSLEPEQTTTFSTYYDWQFSKRGSFDIEYYYEKRKDIHEYIFLPSGNAGLGNAGDANFWGINSNANIPLDWLLPNGLLEVEYTYKSSEYDDPIINDSRSIYNYAPHDLVVNLRQDLSEYKLSWGIEYEADYKKTQYYVDEKQTEEANHRLSSMFVETTQFFGIKTKLKLKDVNVSRYTRSRFFYDESRAGVYQGSEISNRKRELQVLVTFSGSF